MSTTGNEFEQPGVNYPDRRDADGASPGPDEPQRDASGVDAAPTTGGQDELAQEGGGPAPTTDEGPAGAEPPAAAAAEPSHEAVGIGVVDSGDGADHHGQDEGRDTLTVGEAQRTGGLGSEQEQRLPAMAQNDASALEKVSGIVAQTRADVGVEPVERIAEVLRQRLDQAGVDLPDHDIDERARQISTGDASAPDRP